VTEAARFFLRKHYHLDRFFGKSFEHGGGSLRDSDEVITFYITLIASLPKMALLGALSGEEFLKI